MPRFKHYIGSYNQGMVVEYEVTDTTDWVQMIRETMVSCDDDARFKGWGLIRTFNTSTGRGSSYVGRLPKDAVESNWIKDEKTNKWIMEKDVS